MGRIIPSAFAVVGKSGCFVHRLTPQNGGEWVAAQNELGAAVNTWTQNKRVKRVKCCYHKMMVLHNDAMQVEKHLIVSVSNNRPVPASIVPVEPIEGIDDTASTISADALVEIAMGENNSTCSL